jgi:hypothetical protein
LWKNGKWWTDADENSGKFHFFVLILCWFTEKWRKIEQKNGRSRRKGTVSSKEGLFCPLF